MRAEHIPAEHIIKKYHFEKEAEDRIHRMSSALECKVDIRMEYREGEFRYGKVLAGITMGEQADLYRESFLRQDNLTDAYLADCILCEMMMNSYRVFQNRYHKETGRYLSSLKFVGSGEIPLTHLPEALTLLGMKEISCTKNGMLVPLKSVVFYADVSEKDRKECVSVCAMCDNEECGFKHLPI